MDRNERRSRKLKRQQSQTGRSIKPCDRFKANVWRPNKCVHCFFSAAQHRNASEVPVEVDKRELNRLQDLLESGMIQKAEFDKRVADLTGQAQERGKLASSSSEAIQAANVASPSRPLVGSGGASSSTPTLEEAQAVQDIKIDLEAEEEADEVMEGIIVVFFADGSARYNEMTAYALRTFIDATPRIMVGLLARDQQTSDAIVSTLAPSQRHRVLPKLISAKPYFADWNPTQYKLDIAKYAEAFETIFWVDSDTITFGDMTPFLMTFATSPHKFYLTADHVNGDAEFQKGWAAKIGALPIIPQACLMGFKTDIIDYFFTFWRTIWEHWITPAPFVNFPDPNPNFEGSAFCIEQYALGQALDFKPEWAKDVLWFRRQFIAVPKSGQPIDTLPKRATSVTTIQRLIAASPNNLVDVKELRSIALPPKTRTKISNSILHSEHYDYIDRFGNLYHCYNHSWARVRAWYQQLTAYGPQK